MIPTVRTVLDDLRRIAGSDAAAARLIGSSRAALFLSRDRRRLADAATVKAAAALALPPAFLLAALHADMAHDATARACWLDAAGTLAPSAALYYVKSEGPKDQRQPENQEESEELPGASQHHRISGKPRKTESALHCVALSEEKKLALLVLQWCLMVARIPPASPRLAWYVSRWNVPEKIAAAARDGTLAESIAGCPPIDLCHLPAALAAIAESNRYNSSTIIHTPAAPCLHAAQSDAAA